VKKISRHTTLFFDASVLVSGAYSRGGGSALLLEACKLGGFTAQTTFLVIMEALHALERDLPGRSVDRFKGYLGGIAWELLPVPQAKVRQKYASLIDPKDLYVLAAAVEGGCEFLLTLDRRHILAATEAVETAGLSIRILRPGDFIQQYYSLHEELSSLPPQKGWAGPGQKGQLQYENKTQTHHIPPLRGSLGPRHLVCGRGGHA
jgi:predicted nucleic acid-binding protein